MGVKGLINKLFSHTITSKLIEITYELILSVNKYQVGDIRNDKTEHTKKTGDSISD